MLCLMYFKPNIIKKYVHFAIQLCSYNDLLKFTCVLQCTSQRWHVLLQVSNFRNLAKWKVSSFLRFTKQTGTFHLVRFLKLWSSSCWGGRNPFLGLPGFSSPSLRQLLLARPLDPGRPWKRVLPLYVIISLSLTNQQFVCKKKCGFNMVLALRPLNIREDM